MRLVNYDISRWPLPVVLSDKLRYVVKLYPSALFPARHAGFIFTALTFFNSDRDHRLRHLDLPALAEDATQHFVGSGVRCETAEGVVLVGNRALMDEQHVSGRDWLLGMSRYPDLVYWAAGCCKGSEVRCILPPWLLCVLRGCSCGVCPLPLQPQVVG